MSDSNALVVYLCNIMTQPGETTGYGLGDHVTALLRHCPGLRLSFVLANSAEIPEHTLQRYRSQGAVQVVLPGSGATALACPVVREDLLGAGEPLRHDGAKTAAVLQSLFHRTRLSTSASS